MAEIEWTIEQARTGVATLTLARRHVHSTYDPEREAQRLAQQVVEQAKAARHNTLILIGTGLGYVTRKITANWQGPIIEWNPFTELNLEINAAIATGSQPETNLLDKAGIKSAARAPMHVETTSEFDAALATLDADVTRPHLWIHPGYEHVCRFEARYALRALRSLSTSKPKLHRRDALVSERSVAAAAHLPFHPVVDDLKGCLDGQTAIITSAGPSVNLALPLLKQHHGGVRFACIQVLQRYAEVGAHVHFATSADLRNLFNRFAVPNDVPFDILLADSSSQPEMLADHAKRSCLYHQRTPYAHQLPWQECGLDVIDEPNVSVSETSLLLAHRMGARRFVLAGIDLDSADPRYRERFSARNLAGDAVDTNSHYYHASRYLSDYCSKLTTQGCEILRLGSGLPIAGCQSIDAQQLGEILTELPSFQSPAITPQLHQQRLAATQDHITWIAKSARTRSPKRETTEGIARTDAGWRPLDGQICRDLASQALRDLALHSSSAVEG
jgi:hypothetical protein